MVAWQGVAGRRSRPEGVTGVGGGASRERRGDFFLKSLAV